MRAVIFVLALLSAAPSWAQEQRWPTAEANQYWRLKEERVRAYREHDRAFFEALLAEGFVTLGPDGRRLNRAQYLESEFAEGREAGTSTDTEVRDFNAVRTGQTLVLSYEEVGRTAVGDTEFVEHLARLDVYVRQRGRWRLQTMTAVRVPEAPQVIEVSAERLQDYVGSYEFAPGLISVVSLDGAQLVEQTTGQQRTELMPIGPDAFYAPPDVAARVTFERDAAGRVITQVYSADGQTFRAPRTP